MEDAGRRLRYRAFYQAMEELGGILPVGAVRAPGNPPFPQVCLDLLPLQTQRILEELSPTGKDIAAVHVDSVLSLFEEQGNRSICLPFGIRFWRRYGEVRFGAAREQETERRLSFNCTCKTRIVFLSTL